MNYFECEIIETFMNDEKYAEAREKMITLQWDMRLRDEMRYNLKSKANVDVRQFDEDTSVARV